MPLRPSLELRTERLGPLPLINRYLARLDLDALLERFVPTEDRRVRFPYSRGLGVLLRSILVEREPIYRQAETVHTFAPSAFALTDAETGLLDDDRIGRALDRLFEADRGALLTEVALRAVKAFALSLKEFHNDTTSIAFTGQYAGATGRSMRGQRAPWITWGYSKDHRPDLKQLVLILTTTTDGGVPVQFRAADGNTADTTTHIETWKALRGLCGRDDFLYVADSKLCTRENMDWIDGRGGRFVTVLPRTRQEDREFRAWIQKRVPVWERVWDRANPNRKGGPRDRWFVCRDPIPSREGWPVTWVYSTLLALRQERSRRDRMAQALDDLMDLRERLEGGRTRLRTRREIDRRIEKAVIERSVEKYVKVIVRQQEEHEYRQETKGRPGSTTRYRRVTKKRWVIDWAVDEDAINYDRRSDGMYPLITNDKSLSPREVLEAHKRQPQIEKRFAQLKSGQEIAPVFLKNEGRIEALFLLHFLAMLVEGLIERDLRKAMKRDKIESLPLYGEGRSCPLPTCEQIFRLFALAERNTIQQDGSVLNVFDVELTDLQQTVLRLLGVPTSAYRA